MVRFGVFTIENEIFKGIEYLNRPFDAVFPHVPV